jgi:hypothetical protein
MWTTFITNSHPYIATTSLLPLKLVQVLKNEKIASNSQVKFFFKVEKKNATTCCKELNSSQCVQYMKIFPKKISNLEIKNLLTFYDELTYPWC